MLQALADALDRPREKIDRNVAFGVLFSGAIIGYRAYRQWRQRPKCPWAPTSWFLGHLHLALPALMTYSHYDFLSSFFDELGETVGMFFPTQPPMVVTVNPANVEYMLKKNFDNFPKGDLFYSRLFDVLGDGIFNVDGPLWHKQRKIASHMFTANRFKNHIWRVVDKNSAKVIELLRASQGETVDFFNVMNRFTLDSIGEIAFAQSIGSLENANSVFLKSFDRAQQIVFTRFVVPGWQLLRLLGLFTEWGARKHFRLLRDYSLNIVRDLKGKLDGEAGDSFVGLFLKAAEEQGMPTDDKFMADAVLNFLIAGRDTTAQAMSWCMCLILQNPEVEAKILEEADRVTGGSPLAYEQLGKLEYLEATIREALRLYPSVPIDGKVCLEDDTLPDGTFVPAGCTMAYFAYGMGRSKKIWGEDARQFRPERWLSMDAKPDAYAYSVFHAGPRECLGKRLAMVEMKSLLFKVLRAVKLTLAVPPSEIKTDMQLTIGMSSGLPCKVAVR